MATCGVVASSLHVGKVEHAVARLVAVGACRARQLLHPIVVHIPESGGDLVGQLFVNDGFTRGELAPPPPPRALAALAATGHHWSKKHASKKDVMASNNGLQHTRLASVVCLSI